MKKVSKLELSQLRDRLKESRKKFGRDSKQVFKIIKELKTVNNDGYPIDDWEDYSLRSGSFSHCRFNK